MKKKIILLFTAALMIFYIGCEDEPGLKEEDLTELNKITWLKGIWEGKQGDAQLYESWRSKNFRTLEGISYTTVKKERVYIQTMRIEQNFNKIFLTIKLNDAKETQLELNEADENNIVFVNSGEGFPNRVTYHREKDKMVVKLYPDSTEDSTPQQFEYKKTEEV